MHHPLKFNKNIRGKYIEVVKKSQAVTLILKEKRRRLVCSVEVAGE